MDETIDRAAAAMAVVNCDLCDEYGYHGSTVCDHIDHAAAARRGMELVRKALAKGGTE